MNKLIKWSTAIYWLFRKVHLHDSCFLLFDDLPTFAVWQPSNDLVNETGVVIEAAGKGQAEGYFVGNIEGLQIRHQKSDVLRPRLDAFPAGCRDGGQTCQSGRQRPLLGPLLLIHILLDVSLRDLVEFLTAELAGVYFLVGNAGHCEDRCHPGYACSSASRWRRFSERQMPRL